MPPCAVSKKTLTWWCVFGVVTVSERLWRSQSQRYLRPLPGRLGVTPRGRSRRLERVLTDFGAEHSFARAVGSVAEHYGFVIGVSAVRDATLEHAQRARAQLEAHSAQPFRSLPALGAAAPVCRPAQPDQWRRTQQKRLRHKKDSGVATWPR